MTIAETTAASAAIERTLKTLLGAASADRALHDRLKADPARVLEEAGLALPEGVRLSVEEVAPDAIAATAARSTPDHIVLPLPRMAEGTLPDDDLDAVAGGGPLSGILNAVALPFNLLSSFMNSNSSIFLKDRADTLAEGVRKSWNDQGTV